MAQRVQRRRFTAARGVCMLARAWTGRDATRGQELNADAWSKREDRLAR